MVKENAFKQQVLNLQENILGNTFLNREMLDKSAIAVNTGQVGVDTGKNGFKNAREFWLKSGVTPEKVDTLVDTNSRWRFHQHLHELVSKLEYGTLTEFLDYCSEVYDQLEGAVQPTLDATARFPSGFNGHTPETHQKGLEERFLQNLPDLCLSEKQIKLILFAIKYHDEGCNIGRLTHSLNTLGVLFLSYGEEIFQIPDLQPALKAIMFHDEPVVMPVIDGIIKEARALSKGLPESRQVEIVLGMLKEFGSIELFMLLLLDKSDVRRERVRNTRIDKLSTDDLWQDLHFLANIGWKIDHFGLVPNSDETKHNSAFRLKLDFDLSPDDKIATPDNSNLVLRPRDPNRPPEIRMPDAVHRTFKAMSKEKGYFYLISDIYLHLHAQRIILVVLSAFEVYPGIEKVEIVLSDPKTYEAKLGSSEKRQSRSNEDIVLSFNRETLLSGIDSFRIAAESKTPATKIADGLNAVEQGRILIPVIEKHA